VATAGVSIDPAGETLNGTVDPEGVAGTTVHFEYGLDTTYHRSGRLLGHRERIGLAAERPAVLHSASCAPVLEATVGFGLDAVLFKQPLARLEQRPWRSPGTGRCS
jgi:hypothetical protein